MDDQARELERLLNLQDPQPELRSFAELQSVASTHRSPLRPLALVALSVIVALIAGVQLAAFRERSAPAAATPSIATSQPSTGGSPGVLQTSPPAGDLYLLGQRLDVAKPQPLERPAGAPDRGGRMLGVNDRYYFLGDLINLQSGTRLRIAPPARAFTADVDPSGRSVAYINADGALVISRIDALAPDGSGPALQNPDLAGKQFGSALWSPLGHKIYLDRTIAVDATHNVTEPWVLDLASGKAGPVGRFPSVPAASSGGYTSRGLRFVQWSPDDRYLAGWLEATTGSGQSIDLAERRGLTLVVIDTESPSQYDLGPSIAPWTWMMWGPGDGLAFVSGSGDRFSDTTLKVWSGFQPNVSATVLNGGAPAISPRWSANGRLFFITIPDRGALIADYFGGRLARGGAVMAMDSGSQAARTVLAPDAYANTVLRASALGEDLLVQRSPDGSGRDEIWYVRGDGGGFSVPLWPLSAPAWDSGAPPAFITPLLDLAAWSKSPAIRATR